MGVIGVVAALTIPNLNSSTNDKEKVAKVKKLYSNLQDAFGRAESVYGPIDEWFLSDTSYEARSIRLKDRMIDFLKVSKDCGRKDIGCFTDSYIKDLTGTNTSFYPEWSQAHKVILLDGTSAAFIIDSPTCSDDYSVNASGSLSQTCGKLLVDIDGSSKGSFTLGKDCYFFLITKDGIFPEGSSDSKNFNTFDLLKTNCFKGGDCTGWIVENDNMDYLKVDSNGKCPNGTILSWTNTTCN